MERLDYIAKHESRLTVSGAPAGYDAYLAVEAARRRAGPVLFVTADENEAEAALNAMAFFAPDLRRTTIVTTVMFAMSYGAAFGAIQQIPQMVPGLPEVRALFAEMLVTPADRTLVAGNSSLELMHDTVEWASLRGVPGSTAPWCRAWRCGFWKKCWCSSWAPRKCRISASRR